METSSGEHNAFINLNRNYMYMYKDTSYLGSKLPQVTFSKKNKYCSFRLMEQKKTKDLLALSKVTKFVKKGKLFTTKFSQAILRNHLGFITTSAIKLCFMQHQG